MGKVKEQELLKQEWLAEYEANGIPNEVPYDGTGNPQAALSKQIAGNHYQMPIQPVEFITKNNIPYIEGNIIKYVVRHKKKNGKEDLLKAKHYLDMLIEEYK